MGELGTAAFSPALDITVVNRNENEAMYAYRCMKVNLSVLVCLDVVSGVSADFLSFSNAEQVLFSTAGFDIVGYLDGSSPFDARIIVRNTSGNAVFYDISGGV